MALMVLGYLAFAGKSPAKEGQRRLQAVRYRHSESTDRPRSNRSSRRRSPRASRKLHKVAGSGSRVEALAMRLDRTGKGWTLSQYLYASLGIALAVAADHVPEERRGRCCRSGIGVLVGAGLPHFVVG